MAEPWEQYAAAPQGDGPWAQFGTAPTEPDQPGLLNRAAGAVAGAAGMGLMGAELGPVGIGIAGAGGAAIGAKEGITGLAKGFADFFYGTPKRAMTGQMTSEDEIAAGFQAALGTVAAGGTFRVPPETIKAVAPIVKEFDDGITAPAAQRLDSFARAGDPNGVRLEPPTPETVPAPIRPIEGSPFAGVPRSVAAKTGIPEVDSVLASPVTRAVIDNPVIDRSHDVPYMAGGSTPLNDPTVYIDRHVPKEQTISGVTFDPAEPWAVHENVEQHTMELLTKGGMTDDEAYRVAHFQFAEPAEQAWYHAHGIDQVAAEKEQASWLPRIQHEPVDNPPPNLYDKPYPHANVRDAEHEAVAETPPTADEIQRGMDIIRNAPELQPKSAAPMLQEARELGVIGEPPDKSLNELPPREAGQQVMPHSLGAAAVEKAPEQSAWRQRWEETLDKMASSNDVRKVIGGIVDANDEFMPARQGDMRPVQIEQLSDVTGLDSTKFDVAGTSSKIKNDVELRNITEAFRIVNDKIQAAARALAGKRGLDDEAEAGELTRLELQRQLLLESTTATKGLVALRAEWGRAGNTLRDFYKAQRDAAGAEKIKNIDDVRERARLIADAPAEGLPRILILSPLKPMPWYFWAVQQALISGIITHTKYAIVNTGQIFLDRVIAPEIAAAMGKVRGERTSFGAPIDAYNAIIRSVPDAFQGAKLAFKSGSRVPLMSEWELAKRQIENPEAAGAKVPYGSAMSPDWGIWKKVFNDEQLGKAEKVLGVFGRSANAMHTFYKIMGERGSAASRAYDAAFKEGLSPLSDNEKFWQRYAHHAANPSDEALQGTIDDAYAGTFMEKLGEQTRVFAELARNTPLKWVFMFTHIPMNLARSAIRYSPLALLTTLPLKTFDGFEMRAALLGEKGPQAQHLALAKVSIGTSVGAYFIDKALNGAATGDYPTDPKERNRWKVMGIQPNSLQVDGEWHSLERFGPVGGTVPRLAANYAAIIKQYDGSDDESLMNAAFLMALGTASVLTDEVGFETVRNIVNVLENPKEAARTAAYQLATYINPFSVSAQTASAMDPYMREAGTLLNALKYRLPGAREALLPKRDPVFGEPVPNPGYHAILRESPVNTDPIKAELDRIHYYPTAPQRSVGHVKLSDEQYDRYEATAGPLVKQLLQAAMSSPGYRQGNVSQQTAIAKGMIKAGRAKARAALQMADPELVQQGLAARQAQITGR